MPFISSPCKVDRPAPPPRSTYRPPRVLHRPPGGDITHVEKHCPRIRWTRIIFVRGGDENFLYDVSRYSSRQRMLIRVCPAECATVARLCYGRQSGVTGPTMFGAAMAQISKSPSQVLSRKSGFLAVTLFLALDGCWGRETDSNNRENSLSLGRCMAFLIVLKPRVDVSARPIRYLCLTFRPVPSE